MNKKAEWGQAPTLLDWVAYIVLILVIVVAIVIFSWHSDQIKNKIGTITPEQEKGNLLVNILRTPVDIEDAATMGELIAGWYLGNDKFTNNLVEKKLKKILDDFYGYEVTWVLIVGDKQIPTIAGIKYAPLTISNKQLIKMNTDLPLVYNNGELAANMQLLIYESVVKEGALCINLVAQRCTADDKLCKCDALKWKNCEKCDKGCNREKNVCNT